jgi:hypothetical protein
LGLAASRVVPQSPLKREPSEKKPGRDGLAKEGALVLVPSVLRRRNIGTGSETFWSQGLNETRYISVWVVWGLIISIDATVASGQPVSRVGFGFGFGFGWMPRCARHSGGAKAKGFGPDAACFSPTSAEYRAQLLDASAQCPAMDGDHAMRAAVRRFRRPIRRGNWTLRRRLKPCASMHHPLLTLPMLPVDRQDFDPLINGGALCCRMLGLS